MGTLSGFSEPPKSMSVPQASPRPIGRKMSLSSSPVREMNLDAYQAPTEESTALFNAALAGSALGVSNAIKKGGKVNYFHRPEDQKAPLHVAAEAGALEVCKLLLDNGAIVDALAITNKETALSLAASYGHIAVVQLLLDSGAQVNVQNAYGNSPLHEAARHGFAEITSVLISKGGSITMTNNKGSIALHLACYGADKQEFPLALVKVLLQAGSEVNCSDARGTTDRAASPHRAFFSCCVLC